MSEEKKERCFVIMPISDQGDYPKGHFTKVYEQVLKPAIEEAGYEPYRVDEDNICDSIIGKIFEAVQEYPMALCDLSNRNPNVLYELGLRQAYNKPVVLVQDDKTERIFDVSGIKTVQYKHLRLYENVLEARAKIKEALISTRDGKENSIVKVVKANTADFSSVNVSNDDKISIMFNSIMTEIESLKDKTKWNAYDYSSHRPGIRKNNEISLKRNIQRDYSEEGVLALKKGITDTEIKKTLLQARMKFNVEATGIQDKGYFVLQVRGDEEVDVLLAIEFIEDRIGVKK